MEYVQGIPLFGDVVAYGYRFPMNLWRSLAAMNPQNYIRLVAVVGAYLLLRPYLVKLGSKIQEREHEKEIEAEELVPKAKISPNMLRGHDGKEVKIAEDSEDEGEVSGPNWGKKARKRQRAYDKKLVASIEERRRQEQEDEEDKDIEEFFITDKEHLIDGKDIREHLVDYVEGEDGW
ncbi:trafficking PGA2-domain-containing protein [Amylocarpus encephaloides]|uniref:Trafficking PGA2-domain-containing protein n=1 Tax=Amylocarpus encephaloides TaxID=45428 RepID=A0A9P7YE87_9HELO|nr:trafficking PGA2-domain-containing protein [Amylocarpus encephaloides]